MENLQNCRLVDFGVVIPCKMYTKRIKISSSFLVTSIESSKHTRPLDDAFTVRMDPNFDPKLENRLIIKYSPPLPHKKDFAYVIIRFEDGSSQPMYMKGATKGTDIGFSVSKIHFKTNSKIPISQFKFTMENHSDSDDTFCWDFVSEDSEVDISPQNGVIGGHSRLELSITFNPKKIGLFYGAFPCIFKYHEPLYVDVFGFHTKKEMKLDLEKYIHFNRPMTTYPTNYCRYLSDAGTRHFIQNDPPVTVSERYFDFGRIPVDSMGKRGHAIEHLTLTNNDENDFVVVWSNPKGCPFRVDPPKLVLRSLGSTGKFLVSFSPTKPQVIYRTELHASLLWGLRLEYMAPLSVTVHLMGDTFTNEGCGWGPSYSIERTRIVLPGTVPKIPTYTTFKISKTGPLPIQFKLEPIDMTNLFAVKPRAGVIKDDFCLIVIQLLPQDQVDVLFKETWMLTLNKFAQVKLEICGSCELPFLLAGDEKNVIFPATTLGAFAYLKVPVKNPTRLELEYRCQPSFSNIVRVSKDIQRIGPGETQFIEFGYQSPSLGTSSVSQGIWMRWSPYHSAAQKALRGKEISSETVLRLIGTAEEVRIHATPESLAISDVFLYDTSNGSFILSNDGNTMAHIRLRCEVTFMYSHIGEWSAMPNDISLGPGQAVEVKIQVKGVEVGINMFKIQYATYESSLFRIKTSEWTNLVHVEVYVFFSSLSVIDLRYDGLAKSLSKHVLWCLLGINSLNEILGILKTKPEHLSSMKIPEYHEGTPPLKIELLLRNTCPIPLWLHVDVNKSCNCPPQKSDTISRRIIDYSCSHDNQLTAKLDHPQVPAGETVVLTVLVRYEATEECDFNLNLFVSRNPIKTSFRTTDQPSNQDGDVAVDPVVVRINTERGIISGSIASINFLLPTNYGPNLFKCSMEDVYIGDNSRYVQVIWMYNHSQKDNRYWAEWLYVNNRVFRILNARARVAAYSTYPLFIEFNPFEMKTYRVSNHVHCRAKLAVVDEVGDEFHISIEGRGTVWQDVRPLAMLKNMPLDCHFTDVGADIELSQSHFILGLMPTHSFNKYIFFMKNNSKETICFSWECLIVWSTIKVMVQPKAGELQPGEIFPIQMHVHTYRTSAILNFVVECIYFSKTMSNLYWQKCRILQKVTKTFDSCFTFKPDKEIGVAYHNPINVLNAGDPPRNKIVSIGASIRIFNQEFVEETFPNITQQLKLLPSPRIDLRSRANDVMTKEQFYGVTEVLKITIRKLVTSAMFQESIKRKRPALYYRDLPDKGLRLEPKKLPGRLMAMLLGTLLYSSLMKLFGFEAIVYHDVSTSVVGKPQQDSVFKLHNQYYEQMLRTGIAQMCIPPENFRIRRTQSRDQLAFVQRLSL